MVSKTLRWLEDERLIVRTPAGRERAITIRHDSGRDADYTRPGQKDNRDDWFFNLSHAYFLDGWHKKLSASGKALLLVAHANQKRFELNQRRGSEWWGLSTDTIGRGLQDLVQHELLSVRTIRRKAPESRVGFAMVPVYQLEAPFTKPAARPTPSARKPKPRKGAIRTRAKVKKSA
jgi:hypothetical protein